MKAWAKINLTLDVLGKRPDGYHELSSVMQAINLYDTLIIRKTNHQGIELKTNCPTLPTDERNLVYKAAQFLFTEYDIKQGVFIELHKKIPIAAGLAGGSSDCAAALLGLKALLKLDISQKNLFEIGHKLGADVPFCLMINNTDTHIKTEASGNFSFSGTALAEGIGENLKPLSPHPQAHIVLARLPVLVSTKEIFKRWSSITTLSDDPWHKSQKKTSCMVEAIDTRDINVIAANLSNDLTLVATALYPEIAALTAAFWTQNPLGVNMTGSGPTVFAYFPTKSTAFKAVEYIQQRFSNCNIFYTNPKKYSNRQKG